MDDDQKLKIIFYALILLFAVGVIGLWEQFLKPIGAFIARSVTVIF